MKIGLEPGTCEAHAQCNVVDPDLFPLDEDGFSAIEEPTEVPGGEETAARTGVSSCPVRALKLLP